MLILKFHIKTNSRKVYIEEEAKVNEFGNYKDDSFVYLKEAKIPRSLIDGEIVEEWINTGLDEDNGLDFRL